MAIGKRTSVVARAAVALSVVVAGCARPTTPARERRTSAERPATKVPTAQERIEAAIAQGTATPLPRVEITAAPISELPLARNAPAPGAIAMHDDYWPARLLERGGIEPFEWPESEPFASALLKECAPFARAGDVVVTDLRLTRPRIAAATVRASSQVLAECIEKGLSARAGTPYLDLTVRVTARFVAAPSASVVSEDVAALEAALAAFQRVAALGETRPGARAIALDAMASVLLLQDKPLDALAASRAVVCPSRFPFSATSPALAQDHPADYWRAWEQLHPAPVARSTPSAHPALVPGGPRTWEEETTYRSPYEGCQSLDAPPSVVSRSWRRIGAHHLARDVAAGPFRSNRAATAFRRAVASAPASASAEGGEARAFASLDLARTLLTQQRYREASRVLDAVLTSKSPPDAELTSRAAQLLATALTHFDLEGPPESEPSVGDWPDLLDTEVQPAAVARKMRVVLERVDDPALVPPDPATQALVLRALSWELLAVGLHATALAVARTFLERFPMHRDAPRLQWDALLASRMLGAMNRPGSAAAAEGARHEAEERARLSGYVGDTPWTRANRSDAEALAHAVWLSQRP
jgi:hypothetical protein